ncbi:MAG TPA: tetratricopeptide repeat protein [Flavobacterium sp.]|uniref:tetratricopeptide repeat protein n=1 Tax=unclassified Flavobacterium TaxID=196869 RepID=UPI000E94AFF8|nr:MULTISPECIES: tetratricopeptide repeat protein [unclassified Flavobacterium]HBI00125.1 tetratricopeptide repeat protein [Flavobacterium sp.]HRE78439.1 tetratricopeptide repeat protein [Flavobacterium sp.]
MRKKVSVFIVMVFTQLMVGQNHHTDFKKYFQENDTLNLVRVLQEWENFNPNDAELYTSYFNYHVKIAKQETIRLTSEQPNGNALELKDSLNQTAGYLGSDIYYSESDLNKGFTKIDEGIKRFPDRLDMRFGKIYVLGLVSNWDEFTTEIIKTIKHSATNKNEWTWTNNEKHNNGKEFFLSSLQNYQVQLYNTGDDKLLVNMRDIANEILNYYPENIESLSNLSITYLLVGEYDKGIEPLLKAEKINPKDFIILNNIAHGYKLKGDLKKAIKYYEKTIEFGDEQAKKSAKQQIDMLKN